MSSNQDRLYTPCIRKCCLNEDDICLGCFRSLDEIMYWTQADIQTRKRYLDNADNRWQKYTQYSAKFDPLPTDGPTSAPTND
ncbi:MAG: DUF1289 domain-containing protein [Methylococcaceae bacterium]